MGGSVRSACLAALVLAAGATACEPAPPPRTFVVNTTDATDDHDPGDGVCEATPGLGDCSITAAFAEADSAAGPAVVVLPPSDDPYPYVNWDLLHSVTLRAESDPVALEGIDMHLSPAARFTVERVDLGAGTLWVEGTFVAIDTAIAAIGGSGTAPVTVVEGGSAVIMNSFLSNTDPAALSTIENSGTMHLAFSTVVGGDWSTLATGATGVTHLGATALLRNSGDEFGVVCQGDGTVTSGGYNVTADATCGLAGPGDVVGDTTPDDSEPFPALTSPRVDAIPVGALGCGTTLVTDIRGSIRPTDGDGDGTPACDIGAWER